MISVVIGQGAQPGPLVRTLAALVPATVEGLVREVLLCEAAPTAEILDIADQTGVELVSDGQAGAMRQARGPWILLLPAGAVPEPPWTETLAAFIEQAEASADLRRAARIPVRAGEPGLAGRVRALWSGGRTPAAVLARRQTFHTGQPLRFTRLRMRLHA